MLHPGAVAGPVLLPYAGSRAHPLTASYLRLQPTDPRRRADLLVADLRTFEQGRCSVCWPVPRTWWPVVVVRCVGMSPDGVVQFSSSGCGR